jgi:hypothetical protein
LAQGLVLVFELGWASEQEQQVELGFERVLVFEFELKPAQELASVLALVSVSEQTRELSQESRWGQVLDVPLPTLPRYWAAHLKLDFLLQILGPD